MGFFAIFGPRQNKEEVINPLRMAKADKLIVSNQSDSKNVLHSYFSAIKMKLAKKPQRISIIIATESKL